MLDIKRDNTVKKPWYYCVLGVSKRKVIYGGSPDIVKRKCERAIKKGEVSFDPFPENENKEVKDDDTIPF